MLNRILSVMAFLLALAALPAAAEIRIQEIRSPGGLTAWLSESHDLPFIALEIRFRGGTSLDPIQKGGVVNMMTALIEEGAGDLDTYGFASARDSLGAGFSFDAGADAVAVSARMLSENRDEAASLLALALAHPRFDKEAVKRVRQQVLANLRYENKDPATLAARAFDAMAFGDHPYSRPGQGTEDSVAALTRDDIIAAHQQVLTRDHVVVAAAGDITGEELGALIDRILGELPVTGAALPGPAPWNLTPGVTVIDFPSPQSLVHFGQQGMRQDDPDFYAAYILNDVLGGGRFNSRLMTELRDKRGLTYGVGTFFANLAHADMLLGQFSASNDKVAEAIEITRGEWTRIATDGITDQELSDAKTYLTGAYPLRFDGNARIASVLAGMQLQGFPIDYPNTRNDRINAVTAADVKRVAARLFQPDDLHFFVVGQPNGVQSIP